MATSIISPVEDQSILALAPTVKDIPSEATSTQLDTQHDEPTQFDPLATNTSVPSSDDDDDQVESADDGTDTVIGNTNTIVTQENSNAIFATTAAAATDSTLATTTTTTTTTITATAVVAASEEAVEVKDNDTITKESKVEETTAETPESITAPEPKDENIQSTVVPPQPQVVAKEADETKKEVLKTKGEEVEKQIKATPEEVKTIERGDDEPLKSLSRPVSRQDLRRKSSFFNSKDIAVSDRRYSNYSSSSTSSSYSNTSGTSSLVAPSLRPIVDPRYKSRFQNTLAQWRARASN
ncbi:hypothetical protein BGZ80_007612 [Entomortierella chlamydospora]|uniref:Uncharacterized protein n=1 Tax=Entomortierella chlamydospora TaxID=101097 RepID=A0A9P6SS17_9FUNG|nr:hypothetical protein BGZ80_007612 [Entomortierella chlamydospora]KAF9997772.1 hypothetical protein BGZ79_008536 [Entomortierella chlamydospora]